MIGYDSFNDAEEGGAKSPLDDTVSTEEASDGDAAGCFAIVADNPHPQDHLAPPFDSDQRPSTLLVGAFNLIATIIGGGVLSLPIVFKKCGVVVTTVAMMLSAGMTYMSLVMLCYCSRRGGGSSYGEVMRSAFGARMEEAVSWLLGVYLLLSLVAYMILARDVWTPLARQAFGAHLEADYVLLGITCLLLPLLCQRSLHALRKACYLGFVSIFVLCVALCRGGFDNVKDDSVEVHVEYFKMPSAEDVLFCFPIITCAFLCHFNIIAIQNALQKPTRERMQNLTWYAIGACFVLMWMLGLGGYVYAGDDTAGNVLLNVPMSKEGVNASDYYLFLLGRIGCGITILVAMPMNLLPCRESLLEVIDINFHRTHHRTDHEREKCCWTLFHRLNSYESVQDVDITTEDEIFEMSVEGHHLSSEHTEDCGNLHTSVLIRQEPIQSDYVFRNAVSTSSGLLCHYCQH